MANSFKSAGMELLKRRYSPTFCNLSAKTGLRSQALSACASSATAYPPRGPTDAPRRPLWIFLHVPKCGGTTLKAHLERHFAMDEQLVEFSNWGRRYRKEILEAGGSRPALESFKAFRGREPSLDALLRHQGMA